MPIATLILALFGVAQQPPSTPELAVISARLGACSADFTVTDADNKPVYAATVHVRIRYGFMSLKRMDLEVGTNSDGKARVEGLPEKAKPLTYDIARGEAKASVEQNLASSCKATYQVTLK